MAWMFKPYHDARYNNRLPGMNAEKLKRMIRKIEKRISEYVAGGGGEVELKGGYEIIGSDNERNARNGWTFTREHNAASRMVMYLDGVNTFASLTGTKGKKKFHYVFGKKTDWETSFDLTRFYDRLNREEGDIVNRDNFWGGTHLRGGSPKVSGSGICPERFEEIINEEIERAKVDKEAQLVLSK